MSDPVISSCARLAWLGVLLVTGLPPASAATAPRRPNVLVFALDDLRPELGCYGNTIIKTPHIDRLAKRGVVFSHAYAQQSVCSASRTSMLTGLRPDTTGIYDNATHFRSRTPDAVTLPQQFRAHDYHTMGIGKIYHSQWDLAYVGRTLDDPPSWSEPAWFPRTVQFYFSEEGQRVARTVFARSMSCPLDGRALCLHSERLGAPQRGEFNLADPKHDAWKNHFVMGLAAEAPEVPDHLLADGEVADRAILTLRRIKDRPFFLAVGFSRPHVPYVAPKKYWDLYQPESLPLAAAAQAPAGSPAWALLPAHDFAGYTDAPRNGPVPESVARRLMHGYYASVSYADAQLGRVVEELTRLGLAENTIVVVWGDHGFHLGENSRWGKQTCYEQANRQPLIVSVPGQSGNGRKSPGVVESVDIYPTLCELAGIPIPDSLDGTSFAPLLRDPDRAWKSAVFSQFPRPVRPGGGKTGAQPDDKMGYAMRTERYRYIEWRYVLRSEEIAARELYDHRDDAAENRNLADELAQQDVVQRLHAQMVAGWRGALPAVR